MRADGVYLSGESRPSLAQRALRSAPIPVYLSGESRPSLAVKTLQAIPLPLAEISLAYEAHALVISM